MKIQGYRFWPRWLKITLALLILVVVLLPFLPRKMIKSGAPLDYVACEYYSYAQPQGEYLVLTWEQSRELLDILQSLWCYRVWGEDKYFMDDVVLQITLYVDDYPFYVTLGRRDWCEDGTHGPFQQFNIIGGDKATEQILAVLGIDADRVNINGRREE